MDNTAIYRDAFAPYHARLVEQGTARIRSAYARAVQLAGPSVWALFRYDIPLSYFYNEVVSRCTRRDGNMMNSPVYMMNSPVYLDESRLSAFVNEWANTELMAAAEKLAGKVGNLENVTVDYSSSTAEWFSVTGTRANGDIVRIVQNQTINVSSRGKLFNQWPALIYVNGKKVSEAQYKRMAD